jgi:hypothetical protein
MNNTRTLAIVAIFMAATLVVGVTFAAAATTAFAYQKKRGQDSSKDGNTVTIQANKQKGTESGFDNSLAQEAENVICTHPASNSSCVSEGAAAGGGGGGGGGGGVCNSPLVEAHLGTATGVLICVDPSLLTPPGMSGKCTGQTITVVVGTTVLCASI